MTTANEQLHNIFLYVYPPYRHILSEEVVKNIITNVLDHPSVTVGQSDALVRLDQANDDVDELVNALKTFRNELFLAASNVENRIAQLINTTDNTIRKFDDRRTPENPTTYVQPVDEDPRFLETL